MADIVDLPQELTMLPADALSLRQRCYPIMKVEPSHRSLFDRMLKMMRLKQGIGLAAPQVGFQLRMCIVQTGSPQGLNTGTTYMINPVIVNASPNKMMIINEGCLSNPGTEYPVLRHAEIEVAYLDYWGEEQMMAYQGLLAAAIQHEIDHLDGVLSHMRSADNAHLPIMHQKKE